MTRTATAKLGFGSGWLAGWLSGCLAVAMTMAMAMAMAHQRPYKLSNAKRAKHSKTKITYGRALAGTSRFRMLTSIPDPFVLLRSASAMQRGSSPAIMYKAIVSVLRAASTFACKALYAFKVTRLNI